MFLTDILDIISHPKRFQTVTFQKSFLFSDNMIKHIIRVRLAHWENSVKPWTAGVSPRKE
jgi:hypothetical protein